MIDTIIISDTSCLIALEKIDKLDILFQLFSFVVITKEVEEEFGKPLPDWVKIQTVQNLEKQEEFQQIVDDGEASAIALALETENCLLIIDEKKGRKLAKSLQIRIAGTLQILLLGKKKEIIPSLAVLLSELQQKGFRFSPALKEEVLKQANELN